MSCRVPFETSTRRKPQQTEIREEKSVEFSSKGTYFAMFGGLVLVVAAAIAIFNVVDTTSGSSEGVSPAHASQNRDTSREQLTPVSYARAVPTAAPSTTQGPGQIDRTPPRITHFVPPDADQSVKNALADGIVTFEEYTQSVNNTMACLDEKGVEHTEPLYNEASLQYEYGVASSSGPGGVSEYDECHMRFERDVQGAWVQANQSSIHPEPMNEKEALECAAKFGLKVKTFQDLVELKRANPMDVTIQHCFVIGTNGFDPSVPR